MEIEFRKNLQEHNTSNLTENKNAMGVDFEEACEAARGTSEGDW